MLSKAGSAISENFCVLLRLRCMANTTQPQNRSSTNTPPTTPPMIAPTRVLWELDDNRAQEPATPVKLRFTN